MLLIIFRFTLKARKISSCSFLANFNSLFIAWNLYRNNNNQISMAYKEPEGRHHNEHHTLRLGKRWHLRMPGLPVYICDSTIQMKPIHEQDCHQHTEEVVNCKSANEEKQQFWFQKDFRKLLNFISKRRVLIQITNREKETREAKGAWDTHLCISAAICCAQSIVHTKAFSRSNCTHSSSISISSSLTFLKKINYITQDSFLNWLFTIRSFLCCNSGSPQNEILCLAIFKKMKF